MQPPLSEYRSYKWKPPNLISLQFGEGGGRQSEGPLQQSREALIPEFGGRQQLLLRERLRPRLPARPPPPERELQQPPAQRGLPAAARRKVGEKAARDSFRNRLSLPTLARKREFIVVRFPIMSRVSSSASTNLISYSNSLLLRSVHQQAESIVSSALMHF